MATITIYNVSHREDAEPIRRMLDGKTYMRLKVEVAPAEGSFDVLVESDYPEATEQDVWEMTMRVLVSGMLDMSHPAVLRALGEGVDRLNDGDESDIRAARVADRTLLCNMGLVRQNTSYGPKEEATSGYVTDGHGTAWEAWQAADGSWVALDGQKTVPVGPGSTLYADPDLAVKLRTI